MRVPTVLSESVNPFLAARATLLLIEHGSFSSGVLAGEPVRDGVKTVAFPGLGTGVGRVGPQACAKQMRAAIDDVLFHKRTFPSSWGHASEMHQRLYTDRLRNLQM